MPEDRVKKQSDLEKQIPKELSDSCKRKAGRPKWQPEDIAEVEKMASRGLSQEQIGDALGVSADTIGRRKMESAEFAAALKRGKANGVSAVANALFAEAMQGSVSAAIFYLKCKAPDQWNDRPWMAEKKSEKEDEGTDELLW